jgi:hypothetical protein
MYIEIEKLAKLLNISNHHAHQVYYKLQTTMEIDCPRCKKPHILTKLNYETCRYVRLCDNCLINKKKKRYIYPHKQMSNECECGGWFSYYNKKDHLKTQRHKNYLKWNNGLNYQSKLSAKYDGEPTL